MELSKEAADILEAVKNLLRKEGVEEVSDSIAIIWLADTINAYVELIEKYEGKQATVLDVSYEGY